jgi:hypothetical protein
MSLSFASPSRLIAPNERDGLKVSIGLKIYLPYSFQMADPRRPLTLIVASILLSPSIFAAQITYLKGPAEYSKDGKAYLPLKPGDSPSAYLRTAKEGWLIVELKDGSRVKMTPESTLLIIRDEKDGQEIKLESGGIFSNVKKQPDRPPHFTLRTQAVVMGVRGTSFFTAYGKKTDGESHDEWMCVQEGLVEVSGPNQKKPQLVTAGEGVLIDSKKGVTEPQVYEWTKKLNWSMESSAGKVESSVDLDSAYSNLRRLMYE